MLTFRIEEYQKLHPDCIILYHFVGLSNSTSADSLLMLKRLTMQVSYSRFITFYLFIYEYTRLYNLSKQYFHN